MNTREFAVVWLIGTFILVFLHGLVIGPMLAQSASLNLVATGQGNVTQNGTYGNTTASVTLPGFGSVDFSNPTTVGTAIGLIITAAGIIAGASGFVTSGTARGAVSMGAYAALFLGVAVLLVSQLYADFALIPVIGIPGLVVWVTAGMLCIADSAFGKLAGGTS